MINEAEGRKIILKKTHFNEHPPPGLVLFGDFLLVLCLFRFCFVLQQLWQLISLSPGYRCRMGKASDYQLSHVAGQPSSELQFII